MIIAFPIFVACWLLGYLSWCAGYRSWRIPVVPFAVVSVTSAVHAILWTHYLLGTLQ